MKPADIQKLIDDVCKKQKNRPAFFASSKIDLELVDDAIEIEGIGPLKLPMRPKDIRQLIARADSAPYGKGTKTLVDRSVRDSLEIDAACLTFSDRWNAAIEETARTVASELGLPADRIKAKAYKLLMYPRGGFFLPHRDSEKRKSMVASLIVMLPSKFGGGDLVVQHERQQTRFDFKQARQQEACSCAAFYADCLHEVLKVTSGVRVCLSYNLSLKTERKKKAKTTKSPKVDPIQPLVTAIQNWTQSQPATPLVFALEHQYTASGLTPDLLKGKDRTTTKQLIAAAELAECHLHFGQVERHLVEHAMDGYSEPHSRYGRRGRSSYYRKPAVTDVADLEIMEVFGDTVSIDGWKSAAGKSVRMDALSVGSDSIVSQTPLEQWKPTSFDYEGYTGNAGNELSRWYHKSAVAIWSRDDHFRVLVQMGLASSIAQFLKQQSKLLRRKKPDRELLDQQIQFALAIIEGWPDQLYRFNRNQPDHAIHLKDFVNELLQLGSLELLEAFLQTIAIRDWSNSLAPMITASAKQFDPDRLFPVLFRYLETVPQPDEYGRTRASGLPPRDANWLLKIATLKTHAGFSEEQVGQLFEQMLRRVSDKAVELNNERYPQVQSVEEVLHTLMKVAIAIGDEAAFAGCCEIRERLGELLDVRSFDVGVCCKLIAWSDKKYGRRLKGLVEWLGRIRNFLQQATECAPERPTDFTRPADVGCFCRSCQQLAEFLGAADEEQGAIKAFKDDCEHMQGQIKRNQLETTATIDRGTRPYTLRLKKTTASFERAEAQYVSDLESLASLPDA